MGDWGGCDGLLKVLQLFVVDELSFAEINA